MSSLLMRYFYGGLQEEKESHAGFGRSGEAKSGSSRPGRGVCPVSLWKASIALFSALAFANSQRRQRQPLNQGAWFVPRAAHTRAAACCKRPLANEEEFIVSSSPADKTRRLSHVSVGTIARGCPGLCQRLWRGIVPSLPENWVYKRSLF